MVSRPVTAAAGQEASILIWSGTSFPAQVPVRLRPALALVLTHTKAAALRLHAQEGTHWPLTGGQHTITPVRAQRRTMLLPTWTGELGRSSISAPKAPYSSRRDAFSNLV